MIPRGRSQRQLLRFTGKTHPTGLRLVPSNGKRYTGSGKSRDFPRHATSPSPYLPGSKCDVARCIHHRCAYYQSKHTKRDLIRMSGRCTSPASSCTFSSPIAGLYWEIVRYLAAGRSRPGFELGKTPAGRGSSISLCLLLYSYTAQFKVHIELL